MCTVLLTAISTGLQMYGQYQQGQAQQAAYEAQAKAAEQNKAIAQANREQDVMASAQRSEKIVNNWRKAEASRIAAMGKSGLNAAVGSGIDLKNASTQAMQADYATESTNRQFNSWNNYLTQVKYDDQASQYRAAGENAMANARLGMFGTLLSGIGSIYGQGGGTGNTNSSAAATSSSDWYNLGMEKLSKGGAYANTSSLGFDRVTGTFGKSNPYPLVKRQGW